MLEKGVRNITKVTISELRKQGQERRQRDLTYSCPPKIYGDFSKIKMHLNIYKNCMSKKSQWRVQEVDAWNQHVYKLIKKGDKFPLHPYYADYKALRFIADLTQDEKHFRKFRKMYREAKRDQATCCAQYQTFKEEYEKYEYQKYGCKFYTLNLGHRCMFSQQIGGILQSNLFFF